MVEVDHLVPDPDRDVPGPLLVWEDDRLAMVDCVADLLRALSPASVSTGGVVVHDAHGNRVLLRIERARYRRLRLWRAVRERVVVTGKDPAPGHADRVAHRLAGWLERQGEARARELPLGELVRRAALLAPWKARGKR